MHGRTHARTHQHAHISPYTRIEATLTTMIKTKPSYIPSSSASILHESCILVPPSYSSIIFCICPLLNSDKSERRAEIVMMCARLQLRQIKKKKHGKLVWQEKEIDGRSCAQCTSKSRGVKVKNKFKICWDENKSNTRFLLQHLSLRLSIAPTRIPTVQYRLRIDSKGVRKGFSCPCLYHYQSCLLHHI